MTDSQQDQAAVEARARELLACRACGAPCSVQVFEGPSISATLWMCSNHVKLRGDCPDTNAYLSEDAWNTRPALSTPADPVAGDVDAGSLAVPTVPREPTEVMIEAGARAYDFPSAFMGGGSQQGKQTAARVWTAMEASRIRALSPNEASDGEGL